MANATRSTKSRLSAAAIAAAAAIAGLTACSSSKNTDPPASTGAGTGAATSTSTTSPAAFQVNTSDCADPATVSQQVTDTWKIGYSLPLSGPIAGVVQYYLEGWKARINAFNAAGGANGVKIAVDYADDQYTPDKAKANATKFIQSDHVNSMITFGTGQMTAMADLQNSECVPLLYPSSSLQEYRDISQYPWTVEFLPSGVAEATYDVKYIQSQFPNGARVGVAQNQNQSGVSEYKAFAEAAKGTNVKIVVVADETNPNAAATQLAAAHVDVVYNAGINTDCGPLVIALGRIGFKPKFTLNPDTCSNTSAYVQAGQASDGNVVPAYVKNPTDPSLAKDPGLQAYLSQVTTPDKDNAVAVAGWVAADLTVNTIKQAAAMPGGLSRQTVIQAARDQNYTCPMLVNGVTWVSTTTQLTGFSGFQTMVWNAATQKFSPSGPIINVGAS
jgi:branched-chain amino acid transport system substrate-binding protein